MDKDIIFNEKFWEERLAQMEKDGMHPLKAALKKLREAKKNKADEFTLRKLQTNYDNEIKIASLIISSDSFLSDILTNEKSMNEFLSR